MNSKDIQYVNKVIFYSFLRFLLYENKEWQRVGDKWQDNKIVRMQKYIPKINIFKDKKDLDGKVSKPEIIVYFMYEIINDVKYTVIVDFDIRFIINQEDLTKQKDKEILFIESDKELDNYKLELAKKKHILLSLSDKLDEVYELYFNKNEDKY